MCLSELAQTRGTRLYRAAARFVAPILRLPGVRTVYIRRSVASGEAEFPWSDLDLGLVIEELTGREMNVLRRRFLTAGWAFPRLGECQVVSAGELTDLASSDPYRASLDRRFGVTVAGDPPAIPEVSITPRAAARRLVYWFESYLPAAVRRGNLRNQRKFVMEMWNALGVIEGKWAEPLATRRETAARATSDGLIESVETEGAPFAICCRIAARAQNRLFFPAPVIRETVILDGLSPLVVLPGESTPWPASGRLHAATVTTPAVLQLMLETQSTFLWLAHGPALRKLGFSAPSRQAWTEACRRHAGGERLRNPGFVERTPNLHPTILNQVGRVLDALECGELPEGPVSAPPPATFSSVAAYYRDGFDALSETAARLRQRCAQILAGD